MVKSVKQPAPANDSDLADLLERNGGPPSKRTNSGIETADIDLDHLTQGKLEMNTHRKSDYRSVRQIPLLDYISSYVSMLCYYYPVACGFFTMMTIALIMVLLGDLVLNPTEEFGVIKHDHSNIQSKYDLSMGEIDHWCLGGGDKGCRCEDPLVPVSRAERKSWVQSFKSNRRLVKQYEGVALSEDVDVAFLGESVIEEMGGRWMGKQRSPELKSLNTMFLNNFDKKRGARMQGVALGIAGDTAPNVLWRTMHGEMPDYFNPKVWWISLGSNDLARMKCSEEVVVLGILRVVEEILEKKSDARVVINSLFPMAQLRGGRDPTISEFKDSLNGQRGVAVAHSGITNRFDVPNAVVGGKRPVPRPPPYASQTPGARRNLRFKSHPYANPLPPRTHQSEEEVEEEAEAEEVARDKAYRKKNKKRIRKADNASPVLSDARQKKIKKYRAKRGFIGRNRIPLWTSIQAINEQLSKFADSHDRVSFFDVKDIFTKESTERAGAGGRGGISMIDKSKMSVRGHPTARGYAMWEDAILDRMDKLLEMMKREQPELFYGQGVAGDGIDANAEAVHERSDDDLDDAIFDTQIDDVYAYATIGKGGQSGFAKPTGEGVNAASDADVSPTNPASVSGMGFIPAAPVSPNKGTAYGRTGAAPASNNPVSGLGGLPAYGVTGAAPAGNNPVSGLGGESAFGATANTAAGHDDILKGDIDDENDDDHN